MRNPNIRIISRECNIRCYTYEARVCELTGRLLGLRAGCRCWKNFAEAKKHYEGISDRYAAGHWGDNQIAQRLICDRLEYIAAKKEAQGILRKLKRDVEKVQFRIRRRNKRARR